MATLYLSLGSNHRREKNLQAAVKRLREQFSVLDCSPVVRSTAIDNAGDDYFNLVVRLNAALAPAEVRRRLRTIEEQLGRDRTDRQFVSIDIDLLLYDDLVGKVDGFTLPHPDITRYRHVLQPLAHLAADALHPLSGKSFAELLAELPGDLEEVELCLE